MKKSLALVLGFVIALMIAPSANAAVTDIFNSEVSPLTCTADPAPPAPIPANSRFCGNYPAASTVASFDGTPIDVYVALPPDPGGTEPQRQAVGLFHGWGGTKINLKTDPLAQNLLAAGFVVFTMTDRGWGNSCGGPSLPLGASVKTAPCEKGYIHLMHNAYEVRDAQTVLGKLADDKEDTDTNYLIDASKIGAAGGSYGGAISAALAMLKNRVQDSSGNYSTWQSPVNARNMAVAAAAPQYTWSDLAASLVPNGSTLDYASKNPYKGPNDDRRTGTAKQQWVFSLYASGLAAGYYGPAAPIGPGYPDPAANMFGWYAALTTGGPFDGSSTVNSALNEITNNHSSYYIPISPTQTPAPMLISGGWNDDLFPFNEAIRLYNKVRDVTPTTPVAVWGIDIGHTPRSNGNNAARTTDATALIGTQVTWMVRYLRDLPAPWPVPGFNPIGGAVATSSKCGSGGTAEARVAGDLSVGSSWAAMAKGEVTVTGGSTQTIDHHTTPADQFVSSASNADVCDYAGRIEDTPGAAVYTSDPAGSGGYTIIGSPTVDATMDVKGSNDQVIARLYDYDPAGIGHQRLIGRAIYRPMGVGDGPTRQTFQLFPQNYKVSAGNQLKLELLSSDSPFAQNAKNTEQKDLDVSNLKLTVPVAEVSGAAGGQVTDPTPKTLPAGYTMTSDALATDTLDPVTTDDVPAELRSSVTVTLDAVDQGISGVKRTYYEIGASPATPTKFSAVYDSSNKPTLADGQKISYFSVDNAGNEEAVKTSIAAMVDSVPPDTATLVSGPAASITTDSTSVAFSSPELGGTFACSLDGAPSTACTSPVNLTDLAVGAHSFRVWVFDSVGNVSVTPLTVDFTVVGTITASVKVSGTVRAGRTITAKPSATAFGKALSGASYSYKWTVNGKKAGSSSKLKLKSSWKKKKIVVSVTASKAGYTSGSATRTATKRLK